MPLVRPRRPELTAFEETVKRYVAELLARELDSPQVAAYWRGRADEHAFLHDVDRRRAYTAATVRVRAAAESAAGAPA